MIGLIFVICFLFFSLIFLIVLSLIEKELSLVPFIIGNFIVLLILCFGIRGTIKKEGTVCNIEKVQTSYEISEVDGEIKPIPIYSYMILFRTKDGEYRILITKDINYGELKEGDKIIYTTDKTEKIKEN